MNCIVMLAKNWQPVKKAKATLSSATYLHSFQERGSTLSLAADPVRIFDNAPKGLISTLLEIT